MSSRYARGKIISGPPVTGLTLMTITIGCRAPGGSAVKLMSHTTEAEAHGDEKHQDLASGNATSGMAQVK